MFRTSLAVLRLAKRFQHQCGCQTRNFPRFGRATVTFIDPVASTEIQKVENNEIKDDVKTGKFAYSPKPSTTTESKIDANASPNVDETSKKSESESTSQIIRSYYDTDVSHRPNTFNAFYLLKLKIEDKKPLDNASLLFYGLIGAAKLNVGFKFLDLYDAWWTMLKENLHNFSADALCETVDHLGTISVKTRGNLRRKLLSEHIDFLMTEITRFNFVDEVSLRSLGCLYGGLQRLCSFHESGNPKNEYPKNSLVIKTVEYLKHLADNPQQQQQLDEEISGKNDQLFLAVTTGVILNAMSRINYAFDRHALTIFVEILNKSFTVQTNLKDLSFRTFFKMVLIQNRFAESFGRYRVNPDEIVNDSWSNWFSAVKNVLDVFGRQEEHILSTAIPQQQQQAGVFELDDDQQMPNAEAPTTIADATTIELHKMRCRRDLASAIVKLCTQVLDVVTKFSKQDSFLETEFRKTWTAMIDKNVQYANPVVIFHLNSRLRAAEVYLKSQLPFDSQASELVDEKVWNTIRQTADEERQNRDRRKQQFRDSFDGPARRDGSAGGFKQQDDDFGGGFRSFTNRRFADEPTIDNSRNFANRRRQYENEDFANPNTSRKRFGFGDSRDALGGPFRRNIYNRDNVEESNRGFRNPKRRDEPSPSDRFKPELSFKPSPLDPTTFRTRPSAFSSFSAGSRSDADDDNEYGRNENFFEENTRKSFTRRGNRREQNYQDETNPRRRRDRDDFD